MERFLLLSAWIAAVAAVGAVVTRPWTSPAARAPLPVALGIAMAAWVLGTGAFSFTRLMTDGSWTAATITMVFVPSKAIILLLIAYAAGRTFLSARAGGDPRQFVFPVILAAVTVYALGSDALSLRAGTLERHAANPALTAAEVSALVERVRAGDAGRSEAGEFLGNPLCPPELLAEYVGSSDAYWRKAVARNPSIDATIAEKLASDADEEVRFYLAFNRKLPPAILSRLASDTSESVRQTVVWTDTLPDADFNRLVEDQSPGVRATAALQSRLTPEQLEKLRNDPEQRVRDAANRWVARGG